MLLDGFAPLRSALVPRYQTHWVYSYDNLKRGLYRFDVQLYCICSRHAIVKNRCSEFSNICKQKSSPLLEAALMLLAMCLDSESALSCCAILPGVPLQSSYVRTHNTI